MGEKIRTLGDLKIGGGNVEVELNYPLGKGEPRMIHLQNSSFRLEIPENEFLQMAACILLAKRQFDALKGRKVPNKEELRAD